MAWDWSRAVYVCTPTARLDLLRARPSASVAAPAGAGAAWMTAYSVWLASKRPCRPLGRCRGLAAPLCCPCCCAAADVAAPAVAEREKGGGVRAGPAAACPAAAALTGVRRVCRPAGSTSGRLPMSPGKMSVSCSCTHCGSATCRCRQQGAQGPQSTTCCSRAPRVLHAAAGPPEYYILQQAPQSTTSCSSPPRLAAAGQHLGAPGGRQHGRAHWQAGTCVWRRTTCCSMWGWVWCEQVLEQKGGTG